MVPCDITIHKPLCFSSSTPFIWVSHDVTNLCLIVWSHLVSPKVRMDILIQCYQYQLALNDGSSVSALMFICYFSTLEAFPKGSFTNNEHIQVQSLSCVTIGISRNIYKSLGQSWDNILLIRKRNTNSVRFSVDMETLPSWSYTVEMSRKHCIIHNLNECCIIRAHKGTNNTTQKSNTVSTIRLHCINSFRPSDAYMRQ